MAVLSENSFGYDVEFLVVDHDPCHTPTHCGRGSLIVHVDEVTPFAKPVYFYKLDDGSTTNVERVIKRDNYSAGVVPSVTDDTSFGFDVGSKWWDGTNLYECVDGTPGAAVWVKTG